MTWVTSSAETNSSPSLSEGEVGRRLRWNTTESVIFEYAFSSQLYISCAFLHIFVHHFLNRYLFSRSLSVVLSYRFPVHLVNKVWVPRWNTLRRIKIPCGCAEQPPAGIQDISKAGSYMISCVWWEEGLHCFWNTVHRTAKQRYAHSAHTAQLLESCFNAIQMNYSQY